MAKTEDTKSAAAAPVTPVQATPVTAETVKKGGAGKTILIGCCLIIACCVLTIGGLFGLVYFGGASLLSSNKTADTSLTRILTPTDAQVAIDAFQNDESTTFDAAGNATTTLSEKDVLALAIGSLNMQSTPEKVAVKITPDAMKLEINLGALVKAINESNAQSGSSSKIEISGLENVFASINLGVAADGKTITVQDVSVGNGFIDSLLGPTFKQSLEEGIQKGFVEGFEGSDLKLQKIQLQTGKIILSFNAVMPTGYP